jgi:hypothetical protein
LQIDGGASPVEEMGGCQLSRSTKVKKPVDPTISATEDLGCEGVSAFVSVFAFVSPFSGGPPYSKYRAACRYRA